MKYYKRFWDESRGDEHNDWGTSTWYFEVNDIPAIVRQFEVYEKGKISNTR